MSVEDLALDLAIVVMALGMVWLLTHPFGGF